MRKLSGRLPVLAGLAVLSVGLPAWLASCAAGHALNLAELVRWQAGENRRSQELDASCRAACHRMDVKMATAQALVAGRMSLLEAAARFRDLEEEVPDLIPEMFRPTSLAGSEEERLCRRVLDTLEWLRVLDPEGVDAAHCRLEVELQDHLEAGTLRLPARRPGY